MSKTIINEFKHRLFPWTEMRPMIKQVKGTNLVGAEIGVRFGYNALNILKNKHIKNLYLIDPYITYITVGGRTFNEKDENTQLKARKNLSKYKKKTTFIIRTSDDAHKLIKDESLDFCYIDGLHTYQAVKNDIIKYYPKVKKGGYLGGDDFCIKFKGLCVAVIEYSMKHHIDLFGEGKDWWFKK